MRSWALTSKISAAPVFDVTKENGSWLAEVTECTQTRLQEEKSIRNGITMKLPFSSCKESNPPINAHLQAKWTRKFCLRKVRRQRGKPDEFRRISKFLYNAVGRW